MHIMIQDIFDSTKPHRCPWGRKSETCRCPECVSARKFMLARQSLAAAEARNFAPVGRNFPCVQMQRESESTKESLTEKIARQRRERFEESEKTWAYVQATKADSEAHRTKVLAKRKKTEVPSFDLDEVLANPELDGINSVKLDPASMLVDDIELLAKEGKEFINNPTLAGALSMAVVAIPGKFSDGILKGRAGKQARLRELADDPKLGKADRGWLNQDINAINRGSRKNIRNPPGKDLAHERGREAAKGYSYKHSNLQEKKLHRLQHKYDNFGRSNKERPIK